MHVSTHIFLLSSACIHNYDRLIWSICEVVLMVNTNGSVITKITLVNFQSFGHKNGNVLMKLSKMWKDLSSHFLEHQRLCNLTMEKSSITRCAYALNSLAIYLLVLHVSQFFAAMVEKWSQQTTVIRSRPRHPQSNGCIERGNGTMKKILQSLMAEEQTREWIKFLPRVQCKMLLALILYPYAYGYRATYIVKIYAYPAIRIASLQSNRLLVRIPR